MAETLSVATADGPMDLFVAASDGAGTQPGLVVVQEAFGVNDHIKEVTERFAAQGYVAVAPDLFHRFDEPTVAYSEMRAAIGRVMSMTDEQAVMDVQATVGYLQARPDVGKIGLVGYCFGGRTAYLAAAAVSGLSAAVGYYGGGIADPRNPNAPISRTAAISVPLLLLFGALDRMNPLDQVARIEESLREYGKDHQVKVYPEAGHGFFCDARPDSYNAAAAADAWGLTLAFLGEHLS